MRQPFNPLGPLAENIGTRGASGGDIGPPDESTTVLRMAAHESVATILEVTLGLKQVSGKVFEEDKKTWADQGDVHVMVRGRATWGIDGASFDAKFDWMNGTRLSIGAEFLQIEAEYVLCHPKGVTVERSKLPRFSPAVGLAYGGIGRNSNPARYTDWVYLSEIGDFKDIPVPAFATSVTVLPNGSSQAQVEIIGVGSSGAVSLTATGPLANVNQYNVENAVPLFNGARRVRIRNTNTEDLPLTAYVIFGLAL